MAVLQGSFTLQQIMRAETQHWIRTKAGQKLRQQAVSQARILSPAVLEAVLQTYLEECVTRPGNTSHLELVERLLQHGGLTHEALASATPTPANAAAMALYWDIGRRGAACHILGAGAVEHYYAELAPQVFEAYTRIYGIPSDAAETYRIHGPMDRQHSERAFAIVDDAVNTLGWGIVEQSVRDAFVATSLHYDGMLHAASGQLTYWTG